ncbi:MAG: MlaD family protein [Planctomycetota bacterium]|jgi:phospholipid/cholesterol/gamma-HCH transport system substrate-binding protein
MRETTRDFLIGLTALVGLVGLAGLLFFFGEIDVFEPDRYAVTVHLDSAIGLRPKSAVELDGIPVGVVETLGLQADRTHPVRVVTRIDDAVAIPVDVVATVSQMILGGSATLQLSSPQPPTDLGELSRDGTAVVIGSGGSLMTELDARMQPILEALDDFERLADTYVEFGEALTALVRPQTEDEIDAGGQPNLATAVTRLNVAIEEARAALHLATNWLDDEQLRADAKRSFEKANTLIDKATTAIERYTTLAEQLQTDSGDLARRLMPVADELGATLAEVRRVARLAAEGEGTVGLLLNEPDLYRSLDDAAIRLEQTLVDVQLFLRKIRAEGVPLDL